MDNRILILLLVGLFLLAGIYMAWSPSINKYRHDKMQFAPVHIGDIKFSALDQDDDGWLVCNGRSLSRKEYSHLFRAIGTSFGTVSDTTFNLPDSRGRIPGAIGSGPGLTTRVLGTATGQETFTLTLNELPSHHHTGTVDPVGAHTHHNVTGTSGAHNHNVSDAGHTHSQYTYQDDYNGSNTEGQAAPGWVKDAYPNESNTQTWSNINSTSSGISLADASEHTHSITPDGAHVHTFTSGNTGSGNAFGLLQPTLFLGNVLIYAGPAHHVHPEQTPHPTPHHTPRPTPRPTPTPTPTPRP